MRIFAEMYIHADMEVWLLPLLLLAVAFLYASVGHGGASGYLAVMALLGVAPAEMKSSALLLNLLVSLAAFWQYRPHFRWHPFWLFAIASVPLAYLGAKIPLADGTYRKLLAVFLLFPVVRLVQNGIFPLGGAGFQHKTAIPQPVSATLAVGIGGAIGLLSGMLGIGGGILLSPVLLLLRWADLKQAAAMSALFIFVNSAAGLLGLVTRHGNGFGLKNFQLPAHIHIWLACALVGGMLGAYIGSKKLDVRLLRYALALVLAIAAAKLLLT